MVDKREPIEMPAGDNGVNTSHGYRKKQKRHSKKVLLSVLSVLLLAVLLIAYYRIVFVEEEKNEGPTLESRLLTQQQTIGQLQDQLQRLKANLNERSNQAQDTDEHLSDLSLRIDAIEADRRASNLHHLPSEVEVLTVNLDELSVRLQELSHSVDTRFNASKEMEKSFESSLAQVRNNTAATQRSVQRQGSQPQSQHPSPPFSVTGIEMRGDRSYLVVSPGNSGRLSDLRLLREGQSIGQWQLTSIVGRTAEFTVNGQNVVVPVH